MSAATDISNYLEGLPEDRRHDLEQLRAVVLANLPDGYVEVFNWGMISYEVPLTIEPKTYNGKPLMYAAIGSQKNYMVIHLCGLYCLPGKLEKFIQSWNGKKLDMGKACVRFKKAADLDFIAIGKSIAETPVATFVAASKR